MTNNHTPAPTLVNNPKLLFRGIHLSLTEAMRAMLAEKAERLLRHEPCIDRIRIDIEHDATRGREVFVAKGHIEINGPDLIASVTSEDAYKATDLLIDKLDRLLRRRTSLFKARRHRDARVGETAA
ncbi:MAG: ribosome-associated translation inhibitor RaiA [Opitutaceae bacterium]|jgi:putative sigma-54 modulation protein|nr:ribosome-associated translation inhibitor RaiA [Opitutaceae bacterium]